MTMKIKVELTFKCNHCGAFFHYTHFDGEAGTRLNPKDVADRVVFHCCSKDGEKKIYSPTTLQYITMTDYVNEEEDFNNGL